MGMLATVINSLALQDSLGRYDVPSRVMSGIEIPRVAEPYIHGRALRHLEKGRVVIFGGGTGNPYLTTDTAAALRAADIQAELLLLAKFGTNGVYDKDPRRSPDAVKYDTISFNRVLSLNLKVMDHAALAICRDENIPIQVFDMDDENAVYSALTGKELAGTRIQRED